MLTPENFQLIKARSFKGKERSERKCECICTCLICNIKFPHLNINFSKLKHLNFHVNSFLWHCLHELSFRVTNYFLKLYSQETYLIFLFLAKELQKTYFCIFNIWSKFLCNKRYGFPFVNYSKC